MSIKDAYREKLQHQMDEWKDEMQLIKDKIGEMSAEAKINANKALDALKEKQKAAATKLEDLKDASDSVWEEAKAGLNIAWEEIKHDIEAIKKSW